MENEQGVEQPLGPRPAARPPAGGTLSRAQALVLEMLQSQPEAVALTTLAELTGLHVNTLRKHLEALEKRGLVERTQAPPRGRGRPARLFRATDPERRSEYAGLATALAAAIYRTSPTPRADAIAAGAAWGRELAEEKGPPRRSGGPAARRQVIALLDDLGFAPEPDRRHSTARLTRCPLLDAAHRYPEVVCGVHLGITRGALDAYGVSSSAAGLHPFSEPGACRLELREEQP